MSNKPKSASGNDLAKALTPEEVLLKARRFSRGRISARRGCYGGQFDPFNQTWKPLVAGQYIRNSDDPEKGFASKREALSAAWKYRESCRRFAANAKGEA